MDETSSVDVARDAHRIGGSASERKRGAHGFGWRCFLALVALTPLVIGALPVGMGPLALFRAYDPAGVPKVVTILVLCGLSLAALCVSVARGESHLRWHPVLSALVALIAWAAVSTLFSASPALAVRGAYQSNEGLVTILGYGVVAFLAVQYLRSARDLRAVAVAAVAAGSIVSVYALMQFVGVDPYGWINDLGRSFSTMGNPDMLGTYLLFPLALALGLSLSSPRGWARVGSCTAAVLVALALLVTQTLGAWLAAIVVLSVIAALSRDQIRQVSRRQLLVLGGLITSAVAAAVAIVWTRPEFAWRVATLSSGLTNLSNGRFVIWRTGLQGWLAHPITGWGPDGFGHAFQSAAGADWYAIVDGLQTAENAHNFVIQSLVTLGIPGLVLTLVALAYAAIESLRGLKKGGSPARVLFVTLWAALVGMIVALLFGLTVPAVSVWVWLTVGLLVAPISHRVRRPRAGVLVAGAVLGIALTLWAGSWLVADVIVGRAVQMQPGSAQIAGLQTGVRLDPITPEYRWLVAEALVNQSLAEQRAGQDARTSDATLLRAIIAFDAASEADPGDPMVRTALANVLVGLAARRPDTNAAEHAVEVALEAVRLAPHNPAALGALARAYDVSGRDAEAEKTAQLAREVAPEYAAETLGSLGLDGSSEP